MAKSGLALLGLLLAGACFAAEPSTPNQSQQPEAPLVSSVLSTNYISPAPRPQIVNIQPRRQSSGRKLWIASILALGAAQALDTASSLGRRELNPLVRNSQGGFSTGRALALKSGFTAGLLTLEFSLMRNKPEMRKTAAIVNFISAGAIAATAARNRSVPR